MLAPKHLTTGRGRLHQQRFDAGDFIFLHGEKKKMFDGMMAMPTFYHTITLTRICITFVH